jgi:hypothetical protein
MRLIRILLTILRVRLGRYCFRVSTWLAILGMRLAGI